MCDFPFEDEVHFLFHCPAYETKRRNTHCLQAIIATNNNVNQFCVARLLAATSEEAVTELANFIAEAMTLRRKKLT
jgi:16S rRNA C1402 (ribose-2'-O) methylase RsmI